MSETKKPKKIIWITIDTLRADHLGCYGYKRNTSPIVDALSKESILFKWAFSTCSYTMPSHASMFTSRYPAEHSTGFSNGPPVKPIDNDLFLAEILSSQGYETAAFVSAMVLSRKRGVGIHSGFKTYNDTMTRSELNRPNEPIRSGKETNSGVFKWLEENHKNDFFLFINYFDVHGPYVNPEPYDQVFVNDTYYREPQYINAVVPEGRPIGGIPRYQTLRPIRDENMRLINCERDLQYYVAQYDGGIRYVDDRIGEIVQMLKKVGIYDDSFIVVTSDHGEALGENNVYFFHGLTVTPDQVHVPLLIKPHINGHIIPRTVDTHVSSVDIMPTILNLTEFDFRELGLNGSSLVEMMERGEDRELEKRTIRAEIQGQIAHIDKDLIDVAPKEIKRDRGLLYSYVEDLCSRYSQYDYRENRSFDKGPAHQTPRVSIIIVTYNSIKDIKRCVESIYSNTRAPFELIIVDNVSTDGTQEYLSGLTGPTVILNSTNLGFSKASNQGIAQAHGDYIVLLNPDTIVTEDWTTRMIVHFREGVGAVGPVSNYVAGYQKVDLHMDCHKSNGVSVEALGKRLYELRRGRSIETKLLIGFCFMIKREVIDRIGPLDEDLFLGNDDLEYSLRMRMNGYKLRIATDVFIFHKGHTSIGRLKGEEKARFERSEEAHVLFNKLERIFGKYNIPSSTDLWGLEIFGYTPRGYLFQDKMGLKKENKNKNSEDRMETVLQECFAENETMLKRESEERMTSIVILTYNQLEYTRRCIDSLKRFTDAAYELIFVDNGSTDGTVEYLQAVIRDLKSATNCKLIRNRQNLGFAKGCNQGMDIALGEYILLLNNDVVLTEGWLEQMIRCAESDGRIGIVGPCSNYVVGPQLDRDADYSTIEEMHAYAAQFSNHRKGRWFHTSRIIGFCMLIKKEVIEKVGRLDERFGSGNYEDDDYCYRVRMAGYKLMVAGDVFIHHFGSRSFIGNGIDYGKQMERNRRLFLDKWEIRPGTRRHITANRTDLPIESSGKEHAEINVAKGMEYLDSGDLPNALESFKSAIEVDPASSEGHNGLGCVLFRMEKYAEAENNFARAIELNKENPAFWKNLGYVYLNSGRFGDAKRAFETVLPHDYEDLEVVLSLGQIALAEDRRREAMRCFKKATSIDPRYAPAHFNLGMLYKSQEQWEEAGVSFNKVLDLDPENFMLYNALGYCRFQQKREREAIDSFQESLKLNPEQPDIREMITRMGSSVQAQ